MKKIWIWGTGIALLLCTGLVYLLIPSQLKIQKELVIRANINGAMPYCLTKAKVLAWWPGTNTKDSILFFNGFSFRFTKEYEDGPEIMITDEDSRQLVSLFTLIASGPDSVLLDWKTEIPTGMNPIGRLRERSRAVSLKKTMDTVVIHLQRFLEKTENLYGIDVIKGKFTDSVLVTSSWHTTGFPETSKIYEEIGRLEKQVQQYGATATNMPMLHIRKGETGGRDVMVAIPINKEIPVSGGFEIKRLFPGNTLITVVKGGYAAVEKAEAEFERYKIDYTFVSPAIPFQSLVTNRLAVTDSSLWVTKLYYPIF